MRKYLLAFTESSSHCKMLQAYNPKWATSPWLHTQSSLLLPKCLPTISPLPPQWHVCVWYETGLCLHGLQLLAEQENLLVNCLDSPQGLTPEIDLWIVTEMKNWMGCKWELDNWIDSHVFVCFVFVYGWVMWTAYQRCISLPESWSRGHWSSHRSPHRGSSLPHRMLAAQPASPTFFSSLLSAWSLSPWAESALSRDGCGECRTTPKKWVAQTASIYHPLAPYTTILERSQLARQL